MTAVTVVRADLAEPVEVIRAIELAGKRGFTTMEPAEVAGFRPIEGLDIPDAPSYELLDVDAGAEFFNVPPKEALPRILAAGRSPLTLEEGLALVAAQPDVLRTEGCFSMLGSRCGDKRVTALWVKSGGQPRLGWCWEGAPHTWLGAASCAGRKPL